MSWMAFCSEKHLLHQLGSSFLTTNLSERSRKRVEEILAILHASGFGLRDQLIEVDAPSPRHP